MAEVKGIAYTSIDQYIIQMSLKTLRKFKMVLFFVLFVLVGLYFSSLCSQSCNNLLTKIEIRPKYKYEEQRLRLSGNIGNMADKGKIIHLYRNLHSDVCPPACPKWPLSFKLLCLSMSYVCLRPKSVYVLCLSPPECTKWLT